MISHKHKFIFIHICRAGSVSVESTLKKYCEEFYSHQTFSKEKGVDWAGIKREDYFKFAFVRNPWDRLVSLYEWGRQICKHSNPYNWLMHHVNFNTFVRNVEKNRYYKIHIMPMADRLIDESGKIGVDFVGKFERINEDWEEICKKIGIYEKLPHTNKSKHRHYTEYYNDKTREIVGRIYEKDARLFDYKFE